MLVPTATYFVFSNCRHHCWLLINWFRLVPGLQLHGVLLLFIFGHDKVIN